MEKDLADKTDNPNAEEIIPADPTIEESLPADPLTNTQNQNDTKAGKKGSLETKTYVLKKKLDNK